MKYILWFYRIVIVCSWYLIQRYLGYSHTPFSTSVLQNISAVSVFRLLLVVDFLAFVLINVIYILVKFIFTINEKNAKLFNIKALNIACLVIAIIIVISWMLNVNQIPYFISKFLPWGK